MKRRGPPDMSVCEHRMPQPTGGVTPVANRSLNHPAGRHRDPHWLAQQAETHPVALYVVGLAPSTCKSARSSLNSIARMAGAADAWSLDWAALTFQDAQILRARMAERYARSTMNQYLGCLRGVFRACRQLGKIDADTCLSLQGHQARPPAGTSI